ncbi:MULTISPECIES: glycosyltransferase family 4 protein [Pseudoalteromonas]|uniref:glycosyltransferase family 4 protein n=1 Tax=Pseudoalteromonas TaxID=53246 RepID=UPI0015833396|nr:MULTISPECIES: glycosyltransferase family 4 protein [Pseudoalteromonas]MDI4652070.1 glycosyltransferase family 4 protein [Pseudoalteromonas shioyasakiensis]NUJ38395.1 glycosyltransferase family 4 protein [Pseudoalteromonas sp. 0303]
MKVLVVSNMSAKKSAPLQGLFVDNQVKVLQGKSNEIEYYKIKWNTDSLLCRLFKYPFFILCFFWDIILQKEKYDLIHVHFYFPTIILVALYKFLKDKNVKVVVTCHGSDIYSYDPPSYLYKKLSNIVNFWIFTSSELEKRYFRRVSNSEVLCAGYDDRLFYLNEASCSYMNKSYDFLQIGTLNNNKGLDRLLYLVEALPHCRFALVGQGPLENEVKIASKRFSNFNYLGSKSPEHLANVIRKSKYLLSLSRNESFGLTITEAHSCGVPCIATLTDGSIAQIKNSEQLVEQDGVKEGKIKENLKSLAQRMYLLNENEYVKLSHRVSSSTSQYSLSYVTERILSIYKNLRGS